MDDQSDSTFDILKHLGLEESYHKKISISDVMKIGELEGKDEFKIGDVPLIILQKIIMLDRKAVVSQIRRCAKICQGLPQEDVASDDGDDDSLSDMSDLSEDEGQINPADVFLAIFLCCDLNLRQTVVEKMNQCRLAVPFLLPDRSGTNLTFSMWALRSIILSWRDALDIANEASAVNTPLKVVSCLRLGRPQLSKSKLLNTVVNDQVDETFWNVDSPNGNKQRGLSAGLVEASFCLPKSKRSDTSDSVDDVTLFLNLRGDGKQYDKQLMMLSHLSNTVLVCVDIADMSNDDVHSKMRYVHQHCKKVVMILSGGKSMPKSELKRHVQDYKQNVGGNFKMVFSFNADREKNAAHLKDDVSKAIRDRCTEEEYSILKDKIPQLPFEVNVDEIDKYCQRGKKLADKVMSKFDGSPKSKLLPLQQECWKEWCKCLKEKKRSRQASGDSTSVQAVGKIEQKMKQYREKQEKEICEHPNKFIESFIDGLTSDIDDPSIDFYMRWLEMYINDISRQRLPPLVKKYQELKGANKTKYKCSEEIQNIEREISNATMGIEHLMREIGQMYEAATQSTNIGLRKRFRNLPIIAAKLLLKGHALEIMDGDASGVPLVWVQAVFTELEKILGKQKLLSLSVLGIQSSGKSTLLNTMFGLEFPASAGRCTRGVFMQLVKVREDSGLPFNYVAILDSEGLRASELGDSKYDHDNELATFVIGLGNVTLINIKGENVAEIKDILQIVSHAFLRMKMVNKQIQKDRSCMFVHQNIPAIDAKEMMMRGAHKFQETLDNKTREAAELENLTDTYSFNQVIKFDSQKHIWYFPDLWHGDPPMASINNGYHKSIVALKSSLLQEQREQSPMYFGLSEMKIFIENMWNGVLADDFLFCFRNSLVTKAYSHLEEKYSQLKYELEVSAMDWYRRIRLDKSKPEANLHSECENLKREAVAVIRKQQEVLTKELEKFIESDNQKEIMVTWKQQKVFALESTAYTLCDTLNQDINQMLKKKQQHTHKQEILIHTQRLAEHLKTTDEKILLCEFDKMWTEWIGNVSHEKAKVDIEGSVAALLYDLFPAHHSFIECALKERPLNDFPILSSLEGSIKEEHLKDISKHKSEAIVIIDKVFEDCDFKLKRLSRQDSGFQLLDAKKILQKGMLNKGPKLPVMFTTYNVVQLVVHIARYSMRVFHEVQDNYDKKYSATAQLEDYKRTAWNHLLHTVRRTEK